MSSISQLAERGATELAMEEKQLQEKFHRICELALASRYIAKPRRHFSRSYCPNCNKKLKQEKFSQTFAKDSRQYREWAWEALGAPLSTAYAMIHTWKCECGYEYATIYFQDWAGLD